MAYARVDSEAQVGRADQFLEHELEYVRQALAAVLGVAGEAGPAGCGKGLVCLLEASRRAHDAVLKSATLGIARGIQRQEFVLAEAGRLVEHRVHHVARCLLVARESCDRALVIQEVVENKPDVVEWRFVLDHRVPLSSSAVCRFQACARFGPVSPWSLRVA